MRVLVLLLAAFVMCGCVTKQSLLYRWGGYENLLYTSYKDPIGVETMRTKLEAHIAAMEKAGTKVAPGLYAELGTLYLQSGAPDKAIGLYARERDTWPESKALMTVMIDTLERGQAEAKK